MAYSIGNVSGCHINPAVSIAMFVRKKMTLNEFIAYVCAQVVGAFVGSVLLGAFLRDFSVLGGNTIQARLAKEVTLSGLKLDAWSYIAAFLVEVVLTCVFVLAILGVTSQSKTGSVAGLVIGGALVLVHLLGINFTGTSVNPARSFGPALIAGNLKDIWVFIAAPFAGSLLASLCYVLFRKYES
jgi:aquaporin Z